MGPINCAGSQGLAYTKILIKVSMNSCMLCYLIILNLSEINIQTGAVSVTRNTIVYNIYMYSHFM